MNQLNAPILVCGHSHIACINAALAQNKNFTHIKTICLTRSRSHLFNHEDIKSKLNLNNYKPQYIFLSLHGNYHNAFSLIENPKKFYFGDFDCDNENRHFIPTIMVKKHFEILLHKTFNLLMLFKSFFESEIIIFITPPPPIPDPSHLIKYPGTFKKRIHQGIMPKKLRLGSYKIQTSITNAFCAENNIDILHPPTDAINSEGFLKIEYANQDPTHGNKLYGQEVLSQIINWKK
jgi:hypothetical protein